MGWKVSVFHQLGSGFREIEPMDYGFSSCGWGVPAFTLLIIYTASNDVIGDVGGKCWITSEYRYLRWLLYYLPLLLIFIYVCTLCYLTYVSPCVEREQKNHTTFMKHRYKLISNIGISDDIKKKIRNRLMMYSLIFVFIRFLVTF